MNLDELMRRGWKELPSDRLLRENPQAYDSSPMPMSRSFLAFRDPIKKRRHFPAMVPMETLTRRQKPKVPPVSTLTNSRLVCVCEVCEETRPSTRHHLIPVEYWKDGPTVRLCRSCHTSVHFFFTNQQLCETDWSDVVAEVRKHTVYCGPRLLEKVS